MDHTAWRHTNGCRLVLLGASHRDRQAVLDDDDDDRPPDAAEIEECDCACETVASPC